MSVLLSRIDGHDVLARLRARLARDGLNIILPLAAQAFDEVVGAVGGTPLGDLLPGAGGALLVADGGPGFFQRFQSVRARRGKRVTDAAESRDPLDDHTTTVMEAAVVDTLNPPHHAAAVRLLYPFVHARPALPFQRLGQAAGLPAPGPLGIQIHPVYGPWWAYRAMIVVCFTPQAEPILSAACSSCAQPCIGACPARAVSAIGFSLPRCLAHRASALECRDSCAARLACPIGSEHRYPDGQLAFHMKDPVRT